MFKVLLVEDNTDLCELTEYLLVEEGIAVDSFDSAQEALVFASSQTGLYDFCIFNYLMPGMTGLDLYQRLVAKGLTAKCLLCTGLYIDIENEYMQVSGKVELYRKPFDVYTLVHRIMSNLEVVDNKRAQPVSQYQSMGRIASIT
ncbi:response regulator [Pseudobacteriovorax antillogorgiicola]|uniref:Response regulator receiver domain-containing protein n=1 Tax=Pseudobacteriovorax antillogorgiicola TaxID=1513793 RepID=A0A1Y6CKL1_9BACT|nr:response regulator [Pseudobacteriovorax antillogorgiicola]TCS45684.1 response regulator receiver domain-containing protein [Pseudobacteriovorax antillogorgiicola]SMF73208.1 Response regulator receiver domain-containing protein [Pseudobacteriovorax antillogorgiicola]